MGQIKHIAALITRQKRDLLFLGDIERRFTIVATEQQPARPVRLEQIKGSEGRVGYFDSEFYPLDRRFEERWINIALLMMADITAVPPLELVAVEDIYYVIDGHHRVSVAHSLNMLFLDAEVTVWQIAPKPTD
jgi:hypothetical protein